MTGVRVSSHTADQMPCHVARSAVTRTPSMHHIVSVPRGTTHTPATKDGHETASLLVESKRPQEDRRYENNYKMSPDERTRFVPYKVEYIIKTVLDAYLHKVKYDAIHCSKLTEVMCSIIKSKTKELNFDRYKIVVQVYVGEDTDQSVQMASRCLWNPGTDMFATATYRNNSLYAIAVVYGLFLE